MKIEYKNGKIYKINSIPLIHGEVMADIKSINERMLIEQERVRKIVANGQTETRQNNEIQRHLQPSRHQPTHIRENKHIEMIDRSIDVLKPYDNANEDFGISISKNAIGIGDVVQFTSVPENYFRKTGKKLIDASNHWVFNHNPYVIRGKKANKVQEMCNYPHIYEWPKLRKEGMWMNSAECHLSVLGYKDPYLIRPKLYVHEDFPFYERKNIIFHPWGKSHRHLPKKVIDHVVAKYNHENFYQIGSENDPIIPGVKKLNTPDIWSLIKVIAECRLFIGVASGPSMISACYADVTTKQIRTIWQGGYCQPKDWVPLLIANEHSQWNDRLFYEFNCTEHPIAYTETFLRI